MKLGMVSDSLANLPLGAMLDAAASLGFAGVEVNTGNWSAAPHLSLPTLLGSAGAREDFLGAFAERGLVLVALNCNGNQLHPVEGAAQDKVVRDTIQLSGLLGLDTVPLMSGLPGGGPDERVPNWIVSSWPPETQRVLAWQWTERLIPYWTGLVRFAADHGVRRLAIELHGNQLVYNVPTLLRLREAVGPAVGANLDPSHALWMGADPLAMAAALAGAIHHVHAKDTFLNAPALALTGRMENGPLDDVAARAWSYITLGYGQAEHWWRDFCYRLRLAGYDGWLSVEHEDVMLSRREGLEKSVELLRNVMPREPGDYAVAPI
jgi:sugar phosphate isomerase/epimerase